MSAPERASTLFDVLVVGSLNLDLVVRAARLPGPGETVTGSSYEEFPGGKGLNQAVAAARAGASVAFVGAVGDDDAGRQLLDVVAAEGIDDRWIQVIEHIATGRAMITVDDAAENVIVVIPGANAELMWPDHAPECRTLLAQLEVPHAVVAAGLRHGTSCGATTILNPAPAADVEQRLLADCSLVVPNEHELVILGGASMILESGADTVVVTRGASGASIHDDRSVVGVEAFAVDAIDTTGAGDAFCGNLAARLASGATIPDAAKWSCAAGALAATAAGAVPSLPRATDVRALLGH